MCCQSFRGCLFHACGESFVLVELHICGCVWEVSGEGRAFLKSRIHGRYNGSSDGTRIPRVPNGSSSSGVTMRSSAKCWALARPLECFLYSSGFGVWEFSKHVPAHVTRKTFSLICNSGVREKKIGTRMVDVGGCDLRILCVDGKEHDGFNGDP